MNNDLRLLGLKVRDRVSGFTGVCTSISYDLYGCIQAIVNPPINEKGEIPDGRWFDTSRLEVLDEQPVLEIPGSRFSVNREGQRPEPTDTAGPTEKPYR